MLAQTIRKVLLISFLVGLSGCTIVQAPASTASATPQRMVERSNYSAKAGRVNPLRGSTMKQILVAHKAGSVESRKAAPYRKQASAMPRLRATNYTAYTRTEQQELNGLFPRLPNPDLCMYVYPHLSGEGSTVPGYTSCFPLYKQNQYALPGETQ
jgi:conjugative transfer region lipoprotein (TIGR03751 family)